MCLIAESLSALSILDTGGLEEMPLGPGGGCAVVCRANRSRLVSGKEGEFAPEEEDVIYAVMLDSWELHPT